MPKHFHRSPWLQLQDQDSIIILIIVIITIITSKMLTIINIIINIIIIIPTTIQQWLSITQDTAIPYRGSQERALPQHGFRAGHTYQQFIEDPLECYERYERMIHYIEDQ